MFDCYYGYALDVRQVHVVLAYSWAVLLGDVGKSAGFVGCKVFEAEPHPDTFLAKFPRDNSSYFPSLGAEHLVSLFDGSGFSAPWFAGKEDAGRRHDGKERVVAFNF